MSTGESLSPFKNSDPKHEIRTQPNKHLYPTSRYQEKTDNETHQPVTHQSGQKFSQSSHDTQLAMDPFQKTCMHASWLFWILDMSFRFTIATERGILSLTCRPTRIICRIHQTGHIVSDVSTGHDTPEGETTEHKVHPLRHAQMYPCMIPSPTLQALQQDPSTALDPPPAGSAAPPSRRQPGGGGTAPGCCLDFQQDPHRGRHAAGK